tara:strand:- start:212128 stop:212301 length:174 start_codon:yes stop_codon:yes gene_type:complete
MPLAKTHFYMNNVEYGGFLIPPYMELAGSGKRIPGMYLKVLKPASLVTGWRKKSIPF